MFANSLAHGARRRGIVLVLILGMLGLLALIGVTFATFAGQSLINARNFNQSENRPNAEQYMDFALAQLINDTNNPLSSLRGHGLLRDMYGNDSLHRGTTASEYKGFLDRVLVPNGSPPPQYVSVPLQFTGVQPYKSQGNNANSPFAGMNLVQYKTNIPTDKVSYQYNGLNFTRWVLRIANPNNFLAGSFNTPTVPQTFEVLEDDDTGSTNFSGGYHVLTLAPAGGEIAHPTNNSLPPIVPSMLDASATAATPAGAINGIFVGASAALAANNSVNPGFGTPKVLTPLWTLDSSQKIVFPYSFVLDGRYMRAFNGPGMSRSLVAYNGQTSGNLPLVPFDTAAYGNFRANGQLIDPTFPRNLPTAAGGFPTTASFGDPDLIGMDEDYDAPDLENWFLAVQSADGQVVIPSFHRPGILTAQDWSYKVNNPTNTATLNHLAVAGAAKILRPRSVDNSPNFPADPLPDATGKITYDVDNDGDGVTDSVWLDLGYPVQRDISGKLFKPLFAFLIIGQNGRLPLNTAGNLQARDYQNAEMPAWYNDPNSTGDPQFNVPAGKVRVAPHTFYDAPTWDHASHLGVSVNEVNPKYALQNASANVYNSTALITNNLNAIAADRLYSQIDNVGLDVALTQLRNLLAGTVPMDNLTNPNNLAGELNAVAVNGQNWWMPNNVIDGQDVKTNGRVGRLGVTPIPGRWGEVEGVPTVLSVPGIFSNLPANKVPFLYNNPVRAGRSIYSAATFGNHNSFGPTADSDDDDFDSLVPQFNQGVGEYTLSLDNAGQVAIAAQRIQRFNTPYDPAATGRIMAYMKRPNDILDYGTGYETHGLVGYFRYFRPPGIPRDVTYPASYGAPAVDPLYTFNANSPNGFLMPVFGFNASLRHPILPNKTNNLFHGFEGFRAPITDTGNGDSLSVRQAAKIAVFGAAPYDIYSYNSAAAQPYYPIVGDAANSIPVYPTTLPNAPGNTPPFGGVTASPYINSESGPYFFVMPIPPDNLGNVEVPPYFDQAFATVANGYPLGSLNKDEADEMNLYNPNHYDQQFGPSDLEWLYRKHDVDGSTLSSRLSSLAPISFLNPGDGLTRRRLFSLESWEPNSFVYANDNPQGTFPYNSRFGRFASPSFATMNQVVVTTVDDPFNPRNANSLFLASTFGTEGVPNPTLPPPINAWTPNPTFGGPLALPAFLSASGGTTAGGAVTTGTSPPFAATSNPIPQRNVNKHYDLFVDPNPATSITAQPVMTPALAMRDRRINLNMPLPVASDPAEPVRQKWVRETYQLLKQILPPQAIDTPQELAALSQFVLNIVDFRDPDATMTRFVNTDLMVTPPVAAVGGNPAALAGVKFSTIAFPSGANQPSDTAPPWDRSASPATHFFTPFDPMIAYEQTTPKSTSNWQAVMVDASNVPVNPYLVQYGMEYSPIALDEVLCYTYTAQTNNNGGAALTRFYIELVNTLIDDSSHVETYPSKPPAGGAPTPTIPNTPMIPAGTPGAADLNLAGWDLVIMPDDYTGRPDPITGCLPQNIGGIAISAPIVQQMNVPKGILNNVVPFPGNLNPVNAGVTTPGGTQTLPNSFGRFPVFAIGWGLGAGLMQDNNLDNPQTPPPNQAAPVPAISSQSGQMKPYFYVLANRQNPQSATAGYDVAPVDAVPDSFVPDTFFPVTAGYTGVGAVPPPTSVTGQFFWVYLRRPANPFNPTGEMVVVDSMRFPWVRDNGFVGAGGMPPPTGPNSTMPIFSAQRQQPYRGGQLLDPTDFLPLPVPASAFGYTDQTLGNPSLSGLVPPSLPLLNTYPTSKPPGQGGGGAGTQAGGAGYYATPFSGGPTATYTPITKPIVENIGSLVPTQNSNWDHFPFHDRDFTSVAELLLVPGCPPGLFTKQFIENSFSFTPTPTPSAIVTLKTSNLAPGQLVPGPTAGAFTGNLTPAYPYLPDKFYYTAASVIPDPTATTAEAYPTQLGGWTGAGWFKMFEFFEVPSSANGAIGTADNGENYDWARADRRPGLINLNLIIDEEVFFGLLDDPRLNIALAQYGYWLNNNNHTSNPNAPVTTLDPLGSGDLTPFPVGGTGVGVLPRIVTQVLPNGVPNSYYPISDINVVTLTPYVPNSLGTYIGTQNNAPQTASSPKPAFVGRGFTYLDPVTSHVGGGQNTLTGMKAAFADFIKLRHGGSNFLFAHQGEGGSTVPSDMFYRSMSYPDINYTLMRPGIPRATATSFPPPYVYTPPVTTGVPRTSPINNTSVTLTDGSTSPSFSSTSSPPSPPFLVNGNTPTTAMVVPSPNPSVTLDPGLRFPWMDLTFTNYPAYNAPLKDNSGNILAMIPPIPPRRIFQIPDVNLNSNASTHGDSNLNYAGQVGNLATTNYNLADPFSELFSPSPSPANPNTVYSNYVAQPPTANPFSPSPLSAGNSFAAKDFFLHDNRQHPQFRTELLQKMMNLSTVRTHQFAVWITVGFFEVTHAGTPELGLADVLGGELNVAAGTNTRNRSFFLLDRTKATGFNPFYPGEFRECVTYRRRIE